MFNRIMLLNNREKYFFLFLMVFFTSHVTGQVEIEIDTLKLSYVIEKCPNDEIVSHSMMGPYAEFICHIVNNGNDTVRISTLYDDFRTYYMFNYDGVCYKRLIPFLWFDTYYAKDTILTLLPNHKIPITASIHLIYGSDIFPNIQWTDSNRVIDCTKEMIKIMPSLKLLFSNKELNVFSKEIKNVILTSVYYKDYGDRNDWIYLDKNTVSEIHKTKNNKK